MERLTIRNSDGSVSQPMDLKWAEALEKLADYEDAEEQGRLVVRGEWRHDGSRWENRWLCSVCGYLWVFAKEEAYFCPNCGAEMREEENHED